MTLHKVVTQKVVGRKSLTAALLLRLIPALAEVLPDWIMLGVGTLSQVVLAGESLATAGWDGVLAQAARSCTAAVVAVPALVPRRDSRQHPPLLVAGGSASSPPA